MRRGGAWRAWFGGGTLALVAATMIAAAPTVPTAGAGVVEAVGPSEAAASSEVTAAPSEAGVVAGAASVAEAAEPAVLETQEGSASYYADMLTGRRTASGVRYDPSAAVAAHREFPFGTRLRVHNLTNGRTVEVRVVDRGPFARGRILDLSRSAARDLGFIRQGHARVRIEVLEYGG